MGIYENLDKKLEVIKAIKDSNIISPHHIPVSYYVQEAYNLYNWALVDKEALIAAGLPGELVDDLPIRLEALAEAEALWQTERGSEIYGSAEWEKQYALALDLRSRLLDEFRFAFRKHPDLMKNVSVITKDHTQAGVIQGLYDLAVLGRVNRQVLEASRFDMSLLDQAAQTSDQISTLLADVTRDRGNRGEARIVRDQAYTHLKEAVDEIRSYGQHVFRKDKERRMGYRSEHLRQLKHRKSRKPRTKKAEEQSGTNPA